MEHNASHTLVVSGTNWEVDLVHGTPREEAALAQLQRLLQAYDLSPWTFTTNLRIEQGAVPHSHPVLTLNTRHVEDDDTALSVLLHEQLHWYLPRRHDQVDAAVQALRQTYPTVPQDPAQGARSEHSTYLHLVVCSLEYAALTTLCGALRARSIVAGRDVYTWVYQRVLADQPQLQALLQRHCLWITPRLTKTHRVALVTGASRGIGAEVARFLGQRGLDVIVHYRSKRRRAEEVAETIRVEGTQAIVVGAELTSDVDRTLVLQKVSDQFGRLDILVLNASGGLERSVAADYGMQLNNYAQLALVDAALPLMATGSRVVFVTSHFAHFYDTKPVYPAYEPVAASKFAGEQALRARLDDLSAKGISLVVVSGDLIEGTITPRLLERAQPGLIEARRGQARRLPTVKEFAQAVAAAALDESLKSGYTVYVGSTD